MFTGIVSAVGQIQEVLPLKKDDVDAGLRLTIDAANFSLENTKLGDSIAIQGACMTVVEFDQKSFKVDVSRESLNRTTGLDKPGPVNLEHALRLGDSLDGHLVSGHIDGVGKVIEFTPVGESWSLRLRMPEQLARDLAYTCSVAVDAVSLTVDQVHDHDSGSDIDITLIPHALQGTPVKHLIAGDSVNVEVDMIARYVEGMLAKQN